MFRSEQELEHLLFIDLSAVVKVAPVENAFGTTQADQFGFKIETSDAKHFFLADDHKAMWFWVTGIVKWVNHIARAYKRSGTHRVDLSDMQASRDANAQHGKIEMSHAVVKQLMRDSGITDISSAASPKLAPGKFVRSASVSLRRSLGPDELRDTSPAALAAAANAPATPKVRFSDAAAITPSSALASSASTPIPTTTAAPVASTAAAAAAASNTSIPPTPEVLKAGPIEMVMLRPKNETKLSETDADAAVEAMREKVEHILSSVERINVEEARAILLAARAVDEEHNHGRNGASLRATREIPLTSSATLSIADVNGAADDDSAAAAAAVAAAADDMQTRLAAAQSKAKSAEQRALAAEHKVVEGERRRAVVTRTWNERLIEMRRELELVAKARENDTSRWRRRTFDAVLLSQPPTLDAAVADALFARLLTEVSPGAELSEWSEWIAKARNESESSQ